MTDCLFCRIAAGDIPSAPVHETSRTLAFRDVSPQAPSHVLVIPKTHYADLAQLADADPALLADVLAAVVAVARAEELDAGYRVVVNTGPDGGQTVPHVHLHVLGGRGLTWPPG